MNKSRSVEKPFPLIPGYCVWGLICSLSSLDQQKNNLSLFNVIDQFHIPKSAFSEDQSAIALPIPHEIVTLWRRRLDSKIDDRDIDLDISVELIDPQGKSIQQIFTKLEIKQGLRLNRFRIQTNALFVTVPGDYTYKVGCKKLEEGSFKKEFEIPFLVTEH